MTNNEFINLLDKMRSIHEKKAQDYTAGDDPYENFKRCAVVTGWFKEDIDKVFATFITVKLARLASLLGRDKLPNNESISDTFLDLTTYAGLWSSYHESIRGNYTQVNPPRYHMSDITCNTCGKMLTPSNRIQQQNGIYVNYFCSQLCMDSFALLINSRASPQSHNPDL